MPSRKLPPNPKTNPNPNPNRNSNRGGEAIFLGGNCPRTIFLIPIWEFDLLFWTYLLKSTLLFVGFFFLSFLIKLLQCLTSWINAESYPTDNLLFKINNKNSRRMCGICLKLTIKTSKQFHWRSYSVFTVNLKQIAHCSDVFIVDFE